VVYVPLISIPLILGGAFLLHAPLTAWVRRTFREGAQKHALLVEAIAGLETIKSFGAEGRMQRNWERFVAESANSSKALKFLALHRQFLEVLIFGYHRLKNKKKSASKDLQKHSV